MVAVGKGYSKEDAKWYYNFYDVGRSEGAKTDATKKENRLFIDESNKTISGAYRSTTYTLTEVRETN